MFLGELQSLLNGVYALDLSYDIYDFLITDAGLAHALDAGGRHADEKLLIAEDSGEAEVCLYLEAELVDRLTRNNPATCLNDANLEDFWTAFEGVSHFTYYAWNAMLEKPVSLLEMELQAEVDKFIVTSLLLRQQGERSPQGLHHWLFELPKLDSRLDDEEHERYRRANRYAGRYCRKLAPELARGFGDGDLRRELRRFYRFSQPAKIRHIESG
jgi:hypothetical protein